ncbi:MAG: hypothetical protein IAE79_23710 [Anaerolinea sp.]|nr:hypothetical protein [Anaerolinea sp.]
MELFLAVHSGARWFLLLMALLLMSRFALRWWRRLAHTPLDQGMMFAYLITLDLNLLLGLLLLFAFGGGGAENPLARAGLMFLAVLIAHAEAAWRHSGNAPQKFRNSLLVVLLSLVVIRMGT